MLPPTELGCTTAQLALAWVAKQPQTSTVILGASKPEQVTENLKALDVIPKLTPAVLERIEKILDNQPTPVVCTSTYVICGLSNTRTDCDDSPTSGPSQALNSRRQLRCCNASHKYAVYYRNLSRAITSVTTTVHPCNLDQGLVC